MIDVQVVERRMRRVAIVVADAVAERPTDVRERLMMRPAVRLVTDSDAAVAVVLTSTLAVATTRTLPVVYQPGTGCACCARAYINEL